MTQPLPPLTSAQAAGTADHRTPSEVIDTTGHTIELPAVPQTQVADVGADDDRQPISPAPRHWPAPVVPSQSLDRPRDEAQRGVRLALSAASISDDHLATQLTIAERQLAAGDDESMTTARLLIADARSAQRERRPAAAWDLLEAAYAEAGRTDLSFRGRVSARTSHAAQSVSRLAAVIVGLIAIGGIAVAAFNPSDVSTDVLGSFGAYCVVAGLALAGASLSYVFTTRSRLSGPVVDATDPLHLLALHLSVGVLVGLLVVIVLQSGVQNLVNVDGTAAYPWAIAGGFAERLVPRVVQRLAGTEQ